jgi:hypothetical protein
LGKRWKSGDRSARGDAENGRRERTDARGTAVGEGARERPIDHRKTGGTTGAAGSADEGESRPGRGVE